MHCGDAQESFGRLSFRLAIEAVYPGNAIIGFAVSSRTEIFRALAKSYWDQNERLEYVPLESRAFAALPLHSRFVVTFSIVGISVGNGRVEALDYEGTGGECGI